MKNQGTPKVKGKNWNEMMERKLGEGYSFIKKKCFVCGSLSHLIKDCDFYEKKMAREAELKKQRVFNTSKWGAKVNSVRPNVNTGRATVNSVRQNVNSVRSNVNTGSFNINTGRSKQPVPTSNSNSFSPVRPQVNKDIGALLDRPLKNMGGKEVIFDSGRCSRHMTDTLSVLGKFDEKCDEGFLVGYSLNSKAFRVYNLVTKKVEVNLHVKFLEEKPNVKGVGYRWMFDIDYLTNSMNYIPVSLENQTNPHRGTSEVTNNAVKHTATKVGPRMSSTNSKAEEFLTELENLKTQEKEAYSTGISEDTLKI
ncbi:hypothetical protein Tco_0316405 [Tanacetum coccineum]